jgi:murein DD-endopeptidase MepM/ murein hydrolase activator NlpD
MDASWKSAAWALLASAPLLAACTESPETTFDWGVNDRMPRHVARNDVTRGDLPKVYVVQGDAYAVPAPKPRPNYNYQSPNYQASNHQTPSYQPPTYQTPSYRDPGYSATARDNGDAPAFVWPVSGTVISNFGATNNGERNDGINIATDAGTPIHAAAAGTVTYSGNELKDYGNLVLIKHDGGYVTAYAHAERLTVNRGDTVTKGQVIGYAGKTGDVSSPQLHFEIRHDTQPVNPRPLLVARNS